jgi:predicted O-linked N-acetylglucosamine transferase (SPINDLY family)
MNQWQPQAYSYLLQKDYSNAIEIYEQAIADQPEVITNYFYLGIIQLLDGQEAEAQLTWMTCTASDTDYSNPNYFVGNLIGISMQLAYFTPRKDSAIHLLETCLKILPRHLETLEHLSGIYLKIGNYDQALEIARSCMSLAVNSLDRFYPNYLIIKTLLDKGSDWQEVLLTFSKQQSLLSSLINEKVNEIPQLSISRLYTANYFAPYISDRPRHNRSLQNQIAQLCQNNTKIDLFERMERFRLRNRSINQKLKIGYISSGLNSHSVGWLARWLIYHHDRDQFQLHGYFQFYRQYPDPLQSWYEVQMDQVYRVGIDGSDSARDLSAKIYADQIDILIDLDSITLDITCNVMALKPAPIQVTWLGSDASGIPTIDYFIADPYVLPDSAQEYYSEKIWRLPHTYIAVDGFEIGVPNLRRDDLDIPSGAVVYFSAQRGYKRHPDHIRLQMQIIKAVPNSYLLIKGLGDQVSIKNLFTQIAIAEDIDPQRLRFLPMTADETIHRANLAIADVVLDTYPYNGATTTLETLWMCVPLVTKVGEQFAARNSYTMMINAGITEGLAWTDAEYVEWGVRLGEDASLRQDIAARLKDSRQTSPLWNGENFAREMEKAYQQMWQMYIEKGGFEVAESHTSVETQKERKE